MIASTHRFISNQMTKIEKVNDSDKDLIVLYIFKQNGTVWIKVSHELKIGIDLIKV